MAKKLLKALLVLLGVAASFFAVTFTVYFFNLDMKATALIEPLLLKHYDNMPRNRSL